ncbi:MAG: type II toxin-antitoxin system RelE/ParE family toxin [Acidobacteria bacterium]|nr:type II toxin-antitoxin system RelE/ParE family toxin [Acidobacteriota bacterium]
MDAEIKIVIFHDKARETVKGFSKEIRDDIGSLIFKLQQGRHLVLPDARPMRTIATGAYELRVRDADGIYRVFYYLKSAKGILVFHAFTKKTQTTPQSEIETGRKRLWEMLNR